MMERLNESLERDLQKGESQGIEFMADFPRSARDLAKEIAAFATSNAGTIYLGVNDDGKLSGVSDVKNLRDITGKDAFQKRIQGTCGTIKPSIRVKVDFLEKLGKIIIRISVPKGVEPMYYCRGIPYLRDLTSSRPAKPSEVKELHFKYFQKVTPVTPNKEQEFFLKGVLQLSDAQLLLSDYEHHLIRPDVDQMLYDMGATGRTLLELSSESYAEEIGGAEEMMLTGNMLQDLESFEFYLGPESVKKFGELASACLSEVNKLYSRLKKRLAIPTTPDFEDLIEKNIRMLRNEWKNAPKYLERGEFARLQEAFRRLGYTFHRLGNLPDADQYEELSVKLRTLGENLRRVSSWEYFLLTAATNPIEKMKGEVNLYLSIADEILAIIHKS